MNAIVARLVKKGARGVDDGDEDRILDQVEAAILLTALALVVSAVVLSLRA